MADLLKGLQAHYRANGLTAPADLSEKVQDQLCSVLPIGICQQNDPTKVYISGRSLTFADVIRGTKTLTDWFIHGRKKVSVEMAMERARVCAGCVFNQKVQGCSSCSMGPLHALVNSVVGGDRFQGDELLDACMLCGCSNKSAVWLPLDIVQRHLEPEVMAGLPSYCWKKEANASP